MIIKKSIEKVQVKVINLLTPHKNDPAGTGQVWTERDGFAFFMILGDD
jgi:hypothetical protein